MKSLASVRSGASPDVLATVRTLAMRLVRCAGELTISAACRRCAAQPWRALAFIGRGTTMP